MKYYCHLKIQKPNNQKKTLSSPQITFFIGLKLFQIKGMNCFFQLEQWYVERDIISSYQIHPTEVGILVICLIISFSATTLIYSSVSMRK